MEGCYDGYSDATVMYSRRMRSERARSQGSTILVAAGRRNGGEAGHKRATAADSSVGTAATAATAIVGSTE